MTAGGIVIRLATPEDSSALADLKIAWDGADASTAERAEFAEAMREWIDRRGDSLITVVAVDGDEVVGMANILVFPRVPNVGDRDRTTGDVQSVFVLPEHRDRGVGGRMLAALTAEADRRGIPRVTVSSSEGAVTAYRRAGFEPSPVLMQRHRPEG